MRTIEYAVLVATFVAASCSGGDVKEFDGDFITITSVTPDHGPLAGGNEVIVTGSGFRAPGAGLNNFLIGDSLVVVANVFSDSEARVIVPPAVNLDTVDVTSFNGNGSFSLAAAYSYNPEPTISAITPASALNTGGENVTLTGTGFADLEPGANKVFIGSNEATVIEVVSDTELVVETPSGSPPSLIDVSIENDNGAATLPRGFRYSSLGVLVFRHRTTSADAIASETLHVDPLSQVLESALPPKSEDTFEGISVIAFDGTEFIYKSNGNQRLFRLSTEGEHTELGPVEGCPGTRFAAMAFHGGSLFAICDNSTVGSDFGTINIETMTFEPIGAAEIAAGPGSRVNLASNGQDLFGLSGATLGIMDTATGDLTLPVVTDITSARGMAFANGKLFANVGGGGGSTYVLREIDIATGVSSQTMLLGRDIHGVTAVP